MKQAYKNINFRASTLDLIHMIGALIESYQRQGFMLSVRQLYYQLVARDIVPNTERSYKNVASMINDGRLAGLLDWDAIEDRGRDIEVRGRWTSGAQIVQSAARSFHMDMWENQPHRPFVIVEKAALAGVLGGVCTQLDVPLLAARGYPSVSVVREMALEHILPALSAGQEPVIFHLGDHDPSGIDMTRDLEERLRMFIEAEDYQLDGVDRIALTMHQIEEKNPPPNPAKTSDARFASYMREFGDESWELDALEPAYLVDLLTGEIQNYIDIDRWEERKQEIEDIRARLDRVALDFAVN